MEVVSAKTISCVFKMGMTSQTKPELKSSKRAVRSSMDIGLIVFTISFVVVLAIVKISFSETVRVENLFYYKANVSSIPLIGGDIVYARILSTAFVPAD